MQVRVIVLEHESYHFPAPPAIQVRLTPGGAIAEELLNLLDAERLLGKLLSIFTVPEIRRYIIRAPILPILVEGSLRVLSFQLVHCRLIDGG